MTQFLCTHYILRIRLLITILLLAINFKVSAQVDYKIDIYHAFVRNEMDKWKEIIDKMQLQKTKSSDHIVELLNYQYGYIAWCVGTKKFNQAKTYLNLAKENLKYLEQINYNPSLIYAYKSALLSFEIAISPYKAIFLGSKIMDLAKRAIEADNEDPFAYLQYANILYYKPEILGGSKSLAIEYYKKAQKLMEMDKSLSDKNWNYLYLLATIAKAYIELNDYKMAKDYIEKILEIEPNFTWVKNELYPKLTTKFNFEK